MLSRTVDSADGRQDVVGRWPPLAARIARFAVELVGRTYTV